MCHVIASLHPCSAQGGPRGEKWSHEGAKTWENKNKQRGGGIAGRSRDDERQWEGWGGSGRARHVRVQRAVDREQVGVTHHAARHTRTRTKKKKKRSGATSWVFATALPPFFFFQRLCCKMYRRSQARAAALARSAAGGKRGAGAEGGVGAPRQADAIHGLEGAPVRCLHRSRGHERIPTLSVRVLFFVSPLVVPAAHTTPSTHFTLLVEGPR